MLYLYAITEGPEVPDRPGLRDASLRVIGDGDLFAVVSEHGDSRIEASEDDLWAHEDVVEALMDRAAVLPMRFGSSVPDEQAAHALLRERRQEFTDALDRVRDKVELGVRAVARSASEPQPATAGTAGPGTSYMLGRLEQERCDADAAARIHEPLTAIARESARRPSSPSGGVLNAAYLVDRNRIDSFQARVEELADEVDEAAVVCTGPWPPYSFTSMGAKG
jgi:hypothetical protein